MSKEASVDKAKASGCNAVLLWEGSDLPAEVAKLTKGKKANVVYDGIGKVTFKASLNA